MDYSLVPPVFENFENGFRVTVFNNGNEIKNGGINPELKVDVDINMIFKFIEENPGFNILSLRNHFNISKRTLERWIKKLIENHRIEFKGVLKNRRVLGC